jgi:hypothetical protein
LSKPAPRDLSVWISSVLPAASLAFFVGTVFIKPGFWQHWMPGERGIVENAQFLILVAAFYSGFRILLKPSDWPGRGFGIWAGLLTLGFFYIAGEEISWGQHFFSWKTSDWLQEVNSQHETNLHNIRFLSQTLDKVPFRILEAVVFWGGVVYPVLYLWKGHKVNLPAWWNWLLPTAACLPAALAAQAVQIFRAADPLRHFMRDQLPWLSLAEMKEYFVYMFLMIYAASLYARIRHKKEAAAYK